MLRSHVAILDMAVATCTRFNARAEDCVDTKAYRAKEVEYGRTCCTLVLANGQCVIWRLVLSQVLHLLCDIVGIALPTHQYLSSI